jgi:hypothetical protein
LEIVEKIRQVKGGKIQNEQWSIILQKSWRNF